jgi:YVTN family beta-propeller protein
VTNETASTVSVIDTSTNTVFATIPVGVNPVGIAITPPLFAAQIQPPINADGSSVFSAKRGVVPVKFTLTSDGAPTCQLPPARISLARTAGTALGSIDESIFAQSADTGSYFRIDNTNCQYVYNLASSSLGPGTYLVQISISGIAVGSGTFGLN